MPNRLDIYLRDVKRRLSSLPIQIREGEIREMSCHLSLLAADLVSDSTTEDQAMAMAIDRFGSARSTASGISDVWEGNRSLIMAMAVGWVSNVLLQIAQWAAFLIVFLATRQYDGALVVALSPLFLGWFWLNAFALPFAWNYVLGSWGGRRVATAVILTYLPAAWVRLEGDPFAIFPQAVPFETFPLAFSLAVMVAACSGALMGGASRRQRRWSSIGGASFVEAAAALRETKRVPRRAAYFFCGASVLVFSLLGVYLWAQPRVVDILHPATPELAVRALLANPGMDTGDMLPSTEVSVMLLPAVGRSEMAGRERRVAYKATMHATSGMRRRMTTWMRRELAAAGRSSGLFRRSAVQAELQRLAPGGFPARGILRVVSSSRGWRVDASGGAENQPRAWLYIVGFEDQPGVQPRLPD